MESDQHLMALRFLEKLFGVTETDSGDGGGGSVAAVPQFRVPSDLYAEKARFALEYLITVSPGNI